MPVDARIPLMGVPPAQVQPLDLYRPLLAAEQLKNTRTQGQMQQLQLQQAQGVEQRRVALSDALGQYDLSDPAQQRQAMQAATKIDPQTGMAMQAQGLALTREQRLGEAAELAMHEQKNRYLAQVARAIAMDPTPENLAAGLADLKARGYPVEGIPTNLPPEQIRKLAMQYYNKAAPLADRLAELKAQAEMKRADVTLQKDQRELARPNYGYGDVMDAQLDALYGPGTWEQQGYKWTPDQLQAAQQAADTRSVGREVAQFRATAPERAEISRQQGAAIAPIRALSESAQKRLEAVDKSGQVAVDTHTALDEAERLIGQGVYGTGFWDMTRQAAYNTRLVRQDDPKAINTARLREIGAQLILAHGSLGNQVSDNDREVYAKAAGNFEKAKNIEEMRASMASMRTILDKAIANADQTRTQYEQSGTLPSFQEQRQGGRTGEFMTLAQAQAIATARGIAVEQVIQDATAAGFRVR